MRSAPSCVGLPALSDFVERLAGGFKDCRSTENLSVALDHDVTAHGETGETRDWNTASIAEADSEYMDAAEHNTTRAAANAARADNAADWGLTPFIE